MGEDLSMDRRTLLRAVPLSIGGVAGCSTTRGGTNSLSLLSAGSLAQTFDAHVGPAFEAETGITIHGEYYGSNAVMRMVEDSTKHPDVIVSADTTLLRDRLYGEFTDWDVEFAANSLGIGYNDETEFRRSMEGGSRRGSRATLRRDCPPLD